MPDFAMSSYEEKVTIGIELVKYKERMQWQIGDLAATLMQDESVTTDLNLAKFAPDIGLSPRTLQSYVQVARFWPSEYREDYPNLGYSHFKSAMTHSERNLDKAIAMLDYASALGLKNEAFNAWAKEQRAGDLAKMQAKLNALTDLLARAHGILIGVLGSSEILDEIESALGLHVEAG